MTPAEVEELTDAVHTQSARIQRLEDVLRDLLQAQTEQNRVLTSYLVELRGIMESRRPWWRR